MRMDSFSNRAGGAREMIGKRRRGELVGVKWKNGSSIDIDFWEMVELKFLTRFVSL